MDTQQPTNRVTIEQAQAIVEAINPGLPDEDEYDINSEDNWDEWSDE